MRATFAVFAIFFLYSLAFEVDARKELEENAPLRKSESKPNADEQEKSPLNDFQYKPNNPLFFYQNGGADEQEKSSLNDFQYKPNNPLFLYQSGGTDEQEKSLLNDFQYKPNNPLFFYESGGVDEQEKSLRNNFQYKPNNPLFFYESGGADEQEKSLRNDFQYKPNNPLFFYQSGGANEQKKSLLNNFQYKPNSPLFFYQSGGFDEQEKSPVNDFKYKPNNPLFFHQSGGFDEQEKSPVNNFQFKPNNPLFFHQSGGFDEQKKSPVNDFQFKPNNPLFFHQNGDVDEQEKSQLNDLQPKHNSPIYFKYQNKGNNLLRMHDMNSNSKHDSNVHGHDNSPLIVSFTKSYLKKGNKLPIYLPALDHSSKDPPLLSREQAESYPFSYKQFHHLLDLFSVAPKSPQAKSMKEALMFCESKPISGETKFCATSFEAMIDFVSKTFGLASENFKAVTSTQLTKSKNKAQNYKITEEPKEIQTAKVVSCHPISYPYKVFYCHTPKHTKVFRVPVVGENEDVIDAIAACHFDTSERNPNLPVFHEVGDKPGSTYICHFFPSDHLVWIPTEA